MSTRRYADATVPRARRGALRWDAWRQWLSASTFTPPWLPERCGRPLVGYLAAGLLQVAAILATRLLMHVLAPFLFPSLLTIVLVALVALTWGAGPSLLATLVGVVLLHVLVMPPLLDLAGKRPGQPVAVLLFVAAGIVISIAVSQTERARRDAQALAGRLDAVIEAVTDGVVVYDRDGQVEHINAPLRRLVALDQWPESVPPSLRELAALLTVCDSQGRPLPPEHGPAWRVLQGETLIGAAALDVQLRALDGQDLEVSVSGAPIRDHQGRLLGGVLTIHDQTERRRLERRAREALAARDRARADVIATVSHDLQQPLTAIRAGLGLLESSARDRLTCDEQGLLESARRNGERLRLQVDDLLAANQIEAGTLRLDCALLDLRHVVTQALGVMQPLFHEKGQALELDLPAPLPIRGDARRLEQVVINLLANAQRHTPPGTRITVAGCAGTQEVHLVVRDTGPGIPPDELEAIFDRFHHLGHGSAGSGLGLTIVRAIVGLHAGRVWAENSEGGGAAFHVVLPHGKGQGAVQSAHCRG